MHVLQIGSTVEVRTNEGPSTQAVISKLTDASLYTVGQYRGVPPASQNNILLSRASMSKPNQGRGLRHADMQLVSVCVSL